MRTPWRGPPAPAASASPAPLSEPFCAICWLARFVSALVLDPPALEATEPAPVTRPVLDDTLLPEVTEPPVIVTAPTAETFPVIVPPAPMVTVPPEIPPVPDDVMFPPAPRLMF